MLPLILLLYGALAVTMSVIVPLGESPDEVDHFLYVRYLLQRRAFPVMHPLAVDNETMEANQPPLFYLLNAVVTAALPMTEADFFLNACYTFDPHDGGRAHFYLHDAAEQNLLAADYLAFRVARLVSVLLGTLAVWLAYRLGRQMVPGDGRVGLLAAALLAFNPQFVFMTASVNNDVLTAVLGAALVYGSIRAVAHPTPRQFALLGVLMGLALLTKFALLAFWPLLILSALHTPHAARRNLMLVLGLPLLIAGWWYIRAALLYGDPLAWDVHLQAKGVEVLRTTPLALADLREFVIIHFQSYWAWFGWLKLRAPGWVYGVLAVGVGLAAIGVGVVMNDWRLRIDDCRATVRHLFIAQTPVGMTAVPPGTAVPLGTAILFNLLAVAAIYASLLRYILTINWSGYQGRLAFAAAAPIAALLALGWWRLAGGRISFWSPAVGLGALAVGCLLFIVAPAFPRPDVYQPPVAAPRSCVRVAGLDVEAVTVTEGQPGGVVVAQLWLYGVETAVDQPLQVQVLGRAGQVLGQAEAVFSWEAGELWRPSFTLPIIASVEAVRGVVQFGPPGALRDVATVVIRPQRPLPPAPQHGVGADFGGRLRLVGYDWQDGRMTLYWQALAPMDEDYTTFVHVVDAQGGLAAQADSQPHDGAYPTSVWRVGEFVADGKEVALGAERPLRLAVGVYLLATGERLSLADGTDHVLLFALDETQR